MLGVLSYLEGIEDMPECPLRQVHISEEECKEISGKPERKRLQAQER
jgi:hypothetical protein